MPRLLNAVLLTLTIATAGGQIVFDGSMGVGGAGALVPSGVDGKTLAVGQDRGTTVGPNLFHSFSEFGVPGGSTAVFQGNAGLTNILARVTGTSISEINGTIKTEKTNANLFLMNPNGIMFGPGAQVHVDGAFRATTANFIQMADGSLFTASRDGDTTLTSAPPQAFGFDAGTGMAGEIRVTGEGKGSQFLVGLPPPAGDRGLELGGEDLHLVGRAVIVEDTYIRSAGAEIGIVAVGSGEGVVKLDPADGRLSEGGGWEGRVTVSGAVVTVAGASDGRIVLRGGDVAVSNSRRLLDLGIGQAYDGIDASPIRGALGGDVVVEADEIGLSAGGQINVGDGGSIRVTGGKLTIEGSGSIGASRFRALSGDAGPGGTIKIDLSGGLIVKDNGAIFSNTNAANGALVGGAITIVSDGEVLLRNGGEITTDSDGEGGGGPIHITAGALRIDEGQTDNFTGILSQASDRGAGGELDLLVSGHTHIENVGQIASLVSDAGAGGEIVFRGQSLHIVGADVDPESPDPPPNFFLTGINAKASPSSTGPTGSITVDVDGEIRLEDGGLINAAGFSEAADAGDVTVTAGSVFADRMDSYFFTGIGAGSAIDGDDPNRVGGGNGATVSVTAELIALYNGAQINAATRSAGNAGDIRISANRIVADGVGIEPNPFPQFTYSRPSGILAQALGGATGDGGSVRIAPYVGSSGPSGATPSIELSSGAAIAAFSDGTGEAGSVEIDWAAGLVTIGNGSSISARSGVVGGRAGSVTIESQQLLVEPGGRIEVLSEASDAGGITIEGAEFVGVTGATLSAKAKKSGGNITVANTRYLLVDGSVFNASAEEGDGGNIDITTEVFLAQNSTFDVTSRFGADGIVRIDPQVVLSGNEGEIEVDLLDETDSLQPECTQRLATEAGSFIQAGRGGTARLPGGYLPSLRLVSVGGPASGE